ncbi:hypothetical protein ACFWY9_04600 [Amycolatopsis sp. NPDC059027]|uniref:alginate O-acetyltransferase AlgX-related protein n=1 Tax=Amycolatopsis sp. NPDC059027 TaxID=3346709 RepID=UPI00367153B7
MTTKNDKPSPLPPVYEAWLPREHSLYRPRHARRQTIALACAVIFFATPLITVAFGARPSEFENRALTPFPSPGQGWSFFTQLSAWATDHLMFREQAVHAADGISRGVFGEPPPLNHENQQGPLQSPPVKTDPRQFPPIIEGKNGWLYLGDEVSSHCAQAHPLADTFGKLQRLKEGIEASGRQLVVVVAPDKATVVPENLPDAYIGKDCHTAMAAEFWRMVDARQDYILDLRGQITSWGAGKGQPIYGPQDAHWSDEGSVIMARSVAEKLRPGISATWKVTPTAGWQVPADLPPLIGRSGTTSGTHYALMPDGTQDMTRPTPPDYTTPLHLNTASGPGTYGLNVALLGDSFTIRTLPYLAASFRNLTALHASTADRDQGAAASAVLAPSNVVVLELAERSLVRGTVALLDKPGLDNILGRLPR